MAAKANVKSEYCEPPIQNFQTYVFVNESSQTFLLDTYLLPPVSGILCSFLKTCHDFTKITSAKPVWNGHLTLLNELENGDAGFSYWAIGNVLQ